MTHIVDATHDSNFIVPLRFSDGLDGDVDLAAELEGTVFLPLRDPKVFRSFRVHPELGTIVWPNGADFAPKFLRERIRVLT